MSATALKSTKRRFSNVNRKNFEFFRLVPRSPTHTGLICGKTLEPNISSSGPFKIFKEPTPQKSSLLKLLLSSSLLSAEVGFDLPQEEMKD
jgi:hypothetical protein